MTDRDLDSRSKRARSLAMLSFVNAAIWAISLIALVFVMQRCPSAKGMFPILGGGSAVAIMLISTIRRES